VDSTIGSDVQIQEMNAEPTTKPGELSSEVRHEPGRCGFDPYSRYDSERI
jgi:hypothetical protein